MAHKVLIISKLFVFIVSVLVVLNTEAQDVSQESETSHLYRPASERILDTVAATVLSPVMDSLNQDSINARLRFIEDSIQARLQFIQDSLLAREIFVRDSILGRQRMRDSVVFLQAELPRLLEASLRTFSDDVIIASGGVEIKGDSMLTDFISINLPFTIDQPYTPWKTTINLSNAPVRFTVDAVKNKITSLQTNSITCSFIYGRTRDVLRIEGKSSIASTRSGKLYKVPVDSVFFSGQGLITKVKRYILFHEVTANYRKGAFAFLHLDQVKQFDYKSNTLAGYQIVNFCKRERSSDPRKVCNLVNYSISRQGNTCSVSKISEPANEYADGNFTYEFEPADVLKSISFNNANNTENWTTFIEVNEAGNVSRYIYKNKGAVHKTLLVNYNDHPYSKNKVETITCIFEDDGVSYYQLNNTTGKSRSRDKLTMEWGPWR